MGLSDLSGGKVVFAGYAFPHFFQSLSIAKRCKVWVVLEQIEITVADFDRASEPSRCRFRIVEQSMGRTQGIGYVGVDVGIPLDVGGQLLASRM
jgi:hypothetical protein